MPTIDLNPLCERMQAIAAIATAFRERTSPRRRSEFSEHRWGDGLLGWIQKQRRGSVRVRTGLIAGRREADDPTL